MGTNPSSSSLSLNEEERLLTAAPRFVSGGRRAEAGVSGAAAQTAGTETRCPAGGAGHIREGRRTDVTGCFVDLDIWLVWLYEKMSNNRGVYRGRGGDGV